MPILDESLAPHESYSISQIFPNVFVGMGVAVENLERSREVSWKSMADG
jgi:hypothetical protein